MSHSSAIVAPSPAALLHDSTPNPCPSSVTLTEPVDAWLLEPARLTVPTSADTPRVIEPIRTPTLIDTRWLPRALCPILHRTDVADIHAVASHDVPAIALRVMPASPMLAPLNVTLTDPLAARFLSCKALVCPPHTENPLLVLPCLWPALITTRRQPELS